MASAPSGLSHGGRHHRERGRPYASAAYWAELAAHGLRASMSRSGNPYDNAAMESCYATLKGDCLDRKVLSTRAAAQAATFDYVGTFCDRQRRAESGNGT